jgi:hypothetical protein
VAAAPASAPEIAPAPVPAAAPIADASPPVAEPASAAAAPVATEVAPATEGLAFSWLAGAGLVLVIALAGFFLLRRRRSAEEGYDYGEPVHEEPVAAAEPVAAPERDYQPAIVTPAFRRAGTVAEPEVVAAAAAAGLAVQEADRADLDALNASSSPEGHRPWLEFLMRPVRAGSTDDEALVEFELTVGNTGTVAAEDVRISTWMLAGAGSEMESALIEPPAAAATSETRIAPGDGARVDASIALPRARLRGGVLPVVVADARYRLPGGGEGRTSARFAVGLPSGDGLREDVEARLEGEPERV